MLPILKKKFQNWLYDANQYQDDEASESMPVKHAENIVVYVVLHATEGHLMAHWQDVLNAFPLCGMGRPVYYEEAHAIKAVERKSNAKTEGYIALQINRHDVLAMPHDKVPYDAWGQMMVVLRQQAIRQGKIIYFSHANQYRYAWQDGLLKQAAKIAQKID